jgi:hypothetical protein
VSLFDCQMRIVARTVADPVVFAHRHQCIMHPRSYYSSVSLSRNSIKWGPQPASPPTPSAFLGKNCQGTGVRVCQPTMSVESSRDLVASKMGTSPVGAGDGDRTRMASLEGWTMDPVISRKSVLTW